MKAIIALIKEKIGEYLDAYIKLIKLNFIEGTSTVLSYFIFAIIFLFVFSCFIFFLGFGITEALVAWGLPRVASAFITTGFYFLLMLVTLVFRKPLLRAVAGSFIRLMTDKTPKSDTEQE